MPRGPRTEVAALPGVCEVVTDKRELPDLLGPFRRGRYSDRHLDVRQSPAGVCQSAGRLHAAIAASASFRMCGRIWPAGRRSTSSTKFGGWSTTAIARLILTGIHLGHYGVEWNRGRPKPTGCGCRICWSGSPTLSGDFRVRLSSIEATEVTRELLAVMAANPERICPHLHVSMQSGSDAVLRRMRRRWGAQRFVDRCRLAARDARSAGVHDRHHRRLSRRDRGRFRSDVRVAREVGFSKIHIFPFSARPARRPPRCRDQVAPEIKAERCRRLGELEIELRDRYFRQLVGRRLRVLVESPVADRPGRMVGTSCRYAPVELLGDSRFAASSWT